MKYELNDIEALGLTRQRQSVLRVIRESEKHLTANEVFENARQLQPSISFATVYNSLRYLKEKGLIGEIRFGAGANLYDRNLTRHDHAVCNNCGTIVDLEIPLPNGLLKSAADRVNFKAELIEMTLRGLCAECNHQNA